MALTFKNIVDYGFLLIIILVGFIICYEDFKFNKIRNKWIRLGFVLGIIFYILNILILIISDHPIVWHNYLMVLLNTGIAFFLGFTLWYFKLWAGGDAKLFTLYAFLIPLGFYNNWYFKYWPALALLINIILPIFIYLIIKFLLYPIQLGINYLKNPQLLKEYYQKFKGENKIDKTKIKEYISFGVSFLVILIFFQILRTRINDFLTPYLGQLVTFSYLFMSFVIFHPLRALLQKRVILVSSLVSLYFIVGAIFFREIVFADLHKLFALQFIIMMSYFYIFKYGRELGRFLYNSAEVKMVPLAELYEGVYINKDYIRQILGSRDNTEVLKNEISKHLDAEGKEQLESLLKSEKKGKFLDQTFSLLRSLNINAIPNILKQIWKYREQKKQGNLMLENFKAKLSEEQLGKFDDLLNKRNETEMLLKSIWGKLTEKQALDLKTMIEKRNEEVVVKGLMPVDKIILHKTFSFAPWMLLGVIITLLTRSTLIHLFYQYILHK